MVGEKGEGDLMESIVRDKAGIKTTLREEIITSEVAETTHCITQVMERDDRSTMRMNRLGKNPRPITKTLLSAL